MKTKLIASILIALSLSVLSGCTSRPVKSTTRLEALTEQTQGTSKKIEELRTEEDETEFILEADAALKMCLADKGRIRELWAPPPQTKWYQFFK